MGYSRCLSRPPQDHQRVPLRLTVCREQRAPGAVAHDLLHVDGRHPGDRLTGSCAAPLLDFPAPDAAPRRLPRRLPPRSSLSHLPVRTCARFAQVSLPGRHCTAGLLQAFRDGMRPPFWLRFSCQARGLCHVDHCVGCRCGRAANSELFGDADGKLTIKHTCAPACIYITCAVQGNKLTVGLRQLGIITSIAMHGVTDNNTTRYPASYNTLTSTRCHSVNPHMRRSIRRP
jgi:hypothetical protein